MQCFPEDAQPIPIVAVTPSSRVAGGPHVPECRALRAPSPPSGPPGPRSRAPCRLSPPPRSARLREGVWERRADPPHLRVCTLGLYLPLFLFLKSECMLALGARAGSGRAAGGGAGLVTGQRGDPARTEGRQRAQGNRRQLGSPSEALLGRRVTTREGRGARSPRALPAAPGKVVLTFPKEGPSDGRDFPARRARALGRAGGRGAPGLGWGWGYGVFSGHTRTRL